MSAATDTPDAEEFAGLPADAMRFFSELADNQNKEWMAANKARYERSVREPLASLVVALTNCFSAKGIPLQGDPKRSLFRLNRDVRFSADKRPYNDTPAPLLPPGQLALRARRRNAVAGAFGNQSSLKMRDGPENMKY